MTDVDKLMKPHFGSNLSDIWIRIQINTKIQIPIPDHFWLRLDNLEEVCAPQHSTVKTEFNDNNEKVMLYSVFIYWKIIDRLPVSCCKINALKH